MRVLWSHNFDPAEPNSHLLINTAALGMRARGVHLEFEYLGNLRSVANLTSARRRIRRIAAGFDVIHAQYGSACGLATAAADSVPKVMTLRGSDWHVHQGPIGFRFFHSRLAHAMTRRSLTSFDCVVTVSRRMTAEVKPHLPEGTVVTIPSPIDLTRFVPMDKQAARARLGFPGNQERWILFNALNLHDANKRFALAQRAVALVNERCGNVRLRVATHLPHEELPVYAAACDVILCTSRTEGWPNSVKEALACNVPFVATDVSDLRDIARQEPSCRVCAADPSVLADNLCEVLDLPTQPDLRAHVEAMRSDASCDRLVGIYESLVATRVRQRRSH